MHALSSATQCPSDRVHASNHWRHLKGGKWTLNSAKVAEGALIGKGLHILIRRTPKESCATCPKPWVKLATFKKTTTTKQKQQSWCKGLFQSCSWRTSRRECQNPTSENAGWPRSQCRGRCIATSSDITKREKKQSWCKAAKAYVSVVHVASVEESARSPVPKKKPTSWQRRGCRHTQKK